MFIFSVKYVDMSVVPLYINGTTNQSFMNTMAYSFEAAMKPVFVFCGSVSLRPSAKSEAGFFYFYKAES
jgi:hypothetical protein